MSLYRCGSNGGTGPVNYTNCILISGNAVDISNNNIGNFYNILPLNVDVFPLKVYAYPLDLHEGIGAGNKHLPAGEFIFANLNVTRYGVDSSISYEGSIMYSDNDSGTIKTYGQFSGIMGDNSNTMSIITKNGTDIRVGFRALYLVFNSIKTI